MSQKRGLKPLDTPVLYPQMALVFALIWGPGHPVIGEGES